MTSKELITNEVRKLIETVKNSLQDVKKVAVAEAWKVMQLAIASVIQIIEGIGEDLSNPEKKALAMSLMNEFYDKVFTVVILPFVPVILQTIIHKYIKALLMILVSSTIDSMVTVFRNTGVFATPIEVIE
jgi:hypothetical protein